MTKEREEKIKKIATDLRKNYKGVVVDANIGQAKEMISFLLDVNYLLGVILADKDLTNE